MKSSSQPHTKPKARRDARPRLALCALAVALGQALHAQEPTTQSDYGGAGLLQTPTARMAEEGEFAFSASRTYPYTRYNFALQPLPWLEGIFRYTSVANRLYGPRALSGEQSYKDKSIDAKIRLLEESRYLPAVAIGGRDIGGTGLFSSEYVVASKRFGPLDLSLGLAWGYMGGRGDFGNPLGLLDDRFKVRPRAVGTGEFSSNSYFRGKAALFGGVEYHTPWQPLILKLELDGNDYRHEPQNNNQRARWPVNLGAVYRVGDHMDLSLGYERGEKIMLGMTLHANLATQRPVPKLDDPAPEPVVKAAPDTPVDKVDWAAVSRRLQDNAGIRVSQISRRGSELVVSGEQTRYFYPAQGLGRTARILDNSVAPSIEWFTVQTERAGLDTVETSVHRPRFNDYLDQRIDLAGLRRSVEQDPVTPRQQEVLYTAPPQKFSSGFSLGYKQNLGGPDAFVLYQVSADAGADYHFTRNLWWSGVASYNLLNNYDHFTYDAPSNLPRVRTYAREYLTSSRLTMPNFQLTSTRNFGDGLYGMAYGGMLESMFGGVGGEMLYRPFGERWAIGADLNWVRQRGFDQDFSLRRYHVVTGQLTGYLQTGFHDVTMAVSVGRYLAGDWGTTVDVSRQFANGTRMGAYFTITNKSGSRGYGEGSFDKGIYISVPFDLMLPHSTPSRATFLYEPLLRDGGARLAKRYTLYTLTSDQNEQLFQSNLEKIGE